jgi:dipeptidase E
MKAILFSSDFTGLDATKELERLVGKPAKEINFVVLNEAAAASLMESNDNSFFIDGMKFIKDNFGNFAYVNLLALNKRQVAEQVKKCDAIFCFGGSTEWLKKVFDKTGFSEMLPEILKTKVWCGSSAGSMILGKMISKDWQEKLYGSFEDYSVSGYLDLLPFSILPHLAGGDLASDEKDKMVFDISKTVSQDIYALSDWSAVLIDGDKIEVIGKHWSKLRGGKIIERNNK